MGKGSQKVQTGDVTYSLVNTVTNIVITLYVDRCLPDLLWWSFGDEFKCQIPMVYTWNYNIVHQLYFKKNK